MSTKVLVSTSEKKVIRYKRPFWDEYDGPSVALIALGIQAVSALVVALPVSFLSSIGIGASFGISAIVGFGLLFMGLRMINTMDLEGTHKDTVTGEYRSDVSFWSILGRMFLPYSWSKTSHYIAKTTADNDELVRKGTAYHGTALKYEVSTRAIYGPVNSYIEQTFIPTPEAIWDEAFISTKEVYDFDSSNH